MASPVTWCSSLPSRAARCRWQMCPRCYGARTARSATMRWRTRSGQGWWSPCPVPPWPSATISCVRRSARPCLSREHASCTAGSLTTTSWRATRSSPRRMPGRRPRPVTWPARRSCSGRRKRWHPSAPTTPGTWQPLPFARSAQLSRSGWKRACGACRCYAGHSAAPRRSPSPTGSSPVPTTATSSARWRRKPPARSGSAAGSASWHPAPSGHS